MEPFEIMISASQERMLSVVEAERLDGVLAGCARCEVDATAIGEVTGDGPGCACSTTRAWRQRSQRRSHSLTPAHNRFHERPGDRIRAEKGIAGSFGTPVVSRQTDRDR